MNVKYVHLFLITGYMPQDVALYDDLTIEETLIYFGRLYFMEKEKMKLQIDYLLQILDLPDRRRLVCTLSGGQMRRVSFAAALIHEPPLVILDEPTAGVDPLLRSNIWKHLKTICKRSKVTVIITTHYIEEARQADKVGLMRKGQLLAEASPKELLSKFNLPTLEDVFLELCTKIETEKLKGALCEKEKEAENEQIVKSSNISRKKHFHKLQRAISMRSMSRYQRIKSWWAHWWSMFRTLYWKNYIRSIRHPLLLAFQYILPVVQIVLFGICIGGDPFDIKIAIVNEETPPYLSDIFINNLDTYFVDKYIYNSTIEAERAVKRNEIWGYIHLQSNFSDSLIARLNAHNLGDPDKYTIDASKVLIYADLTDRLISVTIERSLEESYQDFIKAVLKDEFDVSPQLATLPIVLGEPVYGSYKHRNHKGYREYMAPGILTSVAFSMAYAVTSLVLILEREEKTFERNFVTGLTPSQVIIAHTLNRMVFMLAQAFLLLFLTVYLFQIPSRGHILAAILLLMTQNLAGIAYGMLLSATFKQTHTAAIVAIGTIFFIFFISGVLWPIQAIPKWGRWFANIQPCTIPISTLRSILSRGWGFYHLEVWKGYGVSIIWTVILFFVSIRNYSYTWKEGNRHYLM